MGDQIQAALIGAVAAILVVLLKDFLSRLLLENRAQKKSEIRVYRSYADPMASSATSLFWRLKEMLGSKGRSVVFRRRENRNTYDQYKYVSTIYRISALIGWIHAYRRETTFFSSEDNRKLGNIRSAISKLAAALSDGDHVEIQRVLGVASLWGIDVSKSREQLNETGIKVERLIEDAVHDVEFSQPNELDEDDQIALVSQVAKSITDELNIPHIPKEVLLETRARAITTLSVRQAWLYRDFQSGIGDMMICEVAGGSRRYDIIGFGEFESFYDTPNNTQKKWIARLERILENLDMSVANKFDARLQLLEELYLGVANLIVQLDKTDRNRFVVSDKVLSAANQVITDQGWRKT